MARIAFIDYFPTHYRRGLYEELGRRADVDFYFFSDQRERWSDPRVPAVWHGSYQRVELPRYRVLGQSIMPGVVQRLLARRYDAVVKSPNGKAMLPLVYGAAKASDTAFVLWLGMWTHPTSRFHRVSKPLMEGIYRGADAIVGYGDHVRNFALTTQGVQPEKVFVAGQAVDSTLFQGVQPERNGTPPEVIFVGQFKEYKGVPYLLDAFAQLRDTGAKLRLIGGGPMLDWVRDQIAGDDAIELVGYRTQEQLPAEIARARCLVLPSVTTQMDREPWGLVVNEAFHAGVPVVASDAVGAAAGGLVVNGRNGLVVPERDADALAAALRRMIESPGLAARMGDQARTDVSAFNYERMARAFLEAVDYGLRRPRRRRNR
jgi:glycosyltransferase involved in cell wall biosynthesis